MQCPVDGCGFESDSERGIGIHCGMVHSVEENSYRIKCECNCCGDEFTVKKSLYESGVGKYCSQECRSEDKTVECECNYCGDEFTVWKSAYEQGGGKYCSKECQSFGLENKVECECNYCGDKFTIIKSHYENGRGKYCSKECQSFGLENKVECECNYCGDKFTVKKSQYELGRGKYCSEKCMGLDNRSANPDLRNSPEYKQFRQTVLERDDHRCVECGDDDDLHVHHVIPIYDDESLATDVDNGKTLCVECHAEAHEELGDPHLAALIRSDGTEFDISVSV